MSEIVDTGEVYIANFLAEIADIFGMNCMVYENYGEGITMNFIGLEVSVFICMEGGDGQCFYQVKNHERDP